MALYSRSFKTKLTEFLTPLGLTDEGQRSFIQEAIRGVLRLDTSKNQALRMVAHRLGIVDDLTHFKYIYLDGSYYLHMELWIQVAKFFQKGQPMDEAVAADFEFMKGYLDEADLASLAHVKTNDHLDLMAARAANMVALTSGKCELDDVADDKKAELSERQALIRGSRIWVAQNPNRGAPCIDARTWETGKNVRRNLSKYVQSKLKPVKFLTKYDPMWGEEDFEQDLAADLIRIGNTYRRSPQTKVKNEDPETFVATEQFQRFAEVSLNLKLKGIQSYHTQEPRRRVKSTLDPFYERRRVLRKLGAETLKDPTTRRAWNEYLLLRKHLVNLQAVVGSDGKVTVSAEMPVERTVGGRFRRSFAELYGVDGEPRTEASRVAAALFLAGADPLRQNAPELEPYGVIKTQIEAFEASELMGALCRRGAVTPECGDAGRINYRISETASAEDKRMAEALLANYGIEIEHRALMAYIDVTPSDYFSQVVPMRHQGHDESDSHEREFLDSDISSEAVGMYSVFDLDADRREADSELYTRDIIKKVAARVRENKVDRKVLHFVRAVVATDDLDPALVEFAESRNRDLTNPNVLIACAQQFYGIKKADLKNPYLTGLVAEHLSKGKPSDRDATET